MKVRRETGTLCGFPEEDSFANEGWCPLKVILSSPISGLFVSVFTKACDNVYLDCDNVYLNKTNSTRLYHLFSTMYQRFAAFRFIKLCFSHSLSMPPSHAL